jgi:hypothetical protein
MIDRLVPTYAPYIQALINIMTAPVLMNSYCKTHIVPTFER